jgi:hypothetical protein
MTVAVPAGDPGAHLDRQSLGRLLHWLQTGEALQRDDPRIPEPFGGTR